MSADKPLNDLIFEVMPVKMVSGQGFNSSKEWQKIRQGFIDGSIEIPSLAFVRGPDIDNNLYPPIIKKLDNLGITHIPYMEYIRWIGRPGNYSWASADSGGLEGVGKSQRVRMGIMISAKDSIQKIRDAGAVFLASDILPEITFTFDPANESISLRSNYPKLDVVKTILGRLNIPYISTEDGITVSEPKPSAIAAVIYSGGRFNGTFQFLERNGFNSGVAK